MMTKTEEIIVSVAAAVAFILGGSLLLYGLTQMEPPPPDPYCEMVAIWKGGESRGLPPEQRFGWPDFRGTFNEECPEWHD